MQVDVQDKGSSRFLKMDFLIVQPTQNELFSRLSCTGELSTVWLLWGAPAVCSSTAPHVAHFPFVMVAGNAVLRAVLFWQLWVPGRQC